MIRLSRFDVTVIAVAALLVIAVVASALLLQVPEQPLRIAYMYPADRGPQNVWAVVPGQPESAAQLTFAEWGVFDYAASPDGRRLAFSERDPATNRVNLKMVDLYSGTLTMLVECASVNADCTTPAWRADSATVAYMRRDSDPLLGGMGSSRIWIIDGLDTNAPETYPLTNDNQTSGSTPIWSKDGRRLAFYEDAGRGVLVFDFNAPDIADTVKFIPADNGMTGTMSPDGELLVTTVLTMSGSQSVRARLVIADLLTNDLRDLYPDGQSNDGQAATWHPDGRRVAILRQYMGGERFTRGQQVYLYDAVDETLTPLINDDTFNNGSLSFSPDGAYLLVQRFQFGAFQPGIWLYDMATGALTEAVPNAYLPSWIPAPE